MNEENILQTPYHETGSSPEQKWPGVLSAYDFVLPSCPDQKLSYAFRLALQAPTTWR